MTNLFQWMETLERKKTEEPLDRRWQIQWKKNEPMSRHTTFRIGGFAALYAICMTEEACIWLCTECRQKNIRHMVLGNGSNVLFSDDGFDGVVISLTALNRIQVEENTVTAQAGALLTAVSKTAKDHCLTGLEFAYGIPGTCGGAVFMNAGAYDGEMKNVVLETVYLDTLTGTVHNLPAEEHRFDYRVSIYREHPEWIILSVKLGLAQGEKESINAKMVDFMGRRTDKQPLDYPSAGSVFKRYPGRYTAQMIDEAGLKGLQIGGAQVSCKHAGFIINTGGATAQDVQMLIQIIKDKIYEKFQIHIECELIQVGEETEHA